MCGIVGVVSSEPAAPTVLSLLRKLEYRGYDSAGIATVSGGKIWIRKGTGKLDEVHQRHRLDQLPGSIGIGHTRWATHGGVTAANAHPHTDCSTTVAVVHNGIIENYRELRSMLELDHTFTSQTDTEVIPHLIESYMTNGASLETAVIRATEQLKGSYAILAISAAEPDKIVAARKDSPLVVGVNGGENFIASDALSFLDRSRQVIYMEEDEVAVLTGDKVRFLDRGGLEIQKTPRTVDWESGEATKQGYDFYMLKEIREGTSSIRRAMIQDRNLISEAALNILRARQVVITGSGTSRYASIIGRYLFSRLAGKLCVVVMSSEFHYFSDAIDKNTLVITVSQSGETADTIRAAKAARENGASVLSLVNPMGSSLERLSNMTFHLNCGPEICVAATKSFMAQLSILYMLSYAMINRLEEGLERLNTVSDLLDESIDEMGTEVMAIANKTRNDRDFYYIAKGINYAIAGEGALKLKEVSYVHAEGMPAGELKHGTLALIEEGTPVVVLCPKDYTFEETLNSAAESKARGGLIVGISDENDPLFDEWVQVPKAEEIFYPLITVVPLQLLAYYAALARGKDPDMPRNLAKSVTVG
jgi:glucosamine--fructose-6-phosphate aminotransferase (isomerizing)